MACGRPGGRATGRLFPRGAMADEIRMLASNAVPAAYSELLPAFEKKTGHRVSVEWGGTVDIVRRASAGEQVDVVVVVVPAGRVDGLVARGIAVKRTDLAASAIGAAARSGLPRLDITTTEALLRVLRTSRTIVLSSGPSSEHMRVLSNDWVLAAISGRRSCNWLLDYRLEKPSPKGAAISVLPRSASS